MFIQTLTFISEGTVKDNVILGIVTHHAVRDVPPWAADNLICCKLPYVPRHEELADFLFICFGLSRILYLAFLCISQVGKYILLRSLE